MSQRSVTASLLLLAILMVAGVVHIVSLLLMPLVAPDDAYARLAAFVPENTMRILPPALTPADPLPDRDPSIITAVCRYDLARAPMRVSATLDAGDFMALSAHSRSGLAFYGLNDRSADASKLEFVVMTAAQRDAAAALDSADAPVRDVRVVAPEDRGFVSLDVLPRSGGGRADRTLASMICRSDRAR